MATLSELEAADALHHVKPSDETSAPERLFYASTRLRDWLVDTLPDLGSNWNLDATPEEQVADLIDLFCEGEELAVGDMFKCLNPHEDAVWELKTADIRIFGWFVYRDCFVGHCADAASRIKEVGLYAGYRGEVRRFRDDLPLDPPKSILGTDPNAVVTNCS